MPGRIALVTGAGRGIGRAIAEGLAADGRRVAVTARTRSELDEVVRAVEQAGQTALAIVADLSERAACARIISQVEQHWGPIEILVNNAGIGSSQNPKPLVEFDDDFWDLTMAVNVTAPYLLTKRTLPAMLAAGWGRIVNISSINAKVAALHAAAYVTSKHAVAGLTKSTAKEIGGTGVTCNAVCPGVTATRLNDKRLEYDAVRLNTTIPQIEAQASPLGRRLLPQEIAAVTVFVCREEANAVNGQLINVCGGTIMD